MKKILFAFGLLLGTAVCSTIKAQTNPSSHGEIVFEQLIRFQFVSPGIYPGSGHPRTPIEEPQIGQAGYTLYFLDETDLTLNLYSVDEVGDETLEYTTFVSATTTEVQLPSSLSGAYIIEVVRDTLCFRGEIEL